MNMKMYTLLIIYFGLILEAAATKFSFLSLLMIGERLLDDRVGEAFIEEAPEAMEGEAILDFG